MLTIKNKFGKNAILKGMNLEEGATAKERTDWWTQQSINRRKRDYGQCILGKPANGIGNRAIYQPATP